MEIIDPSESIIPIMKAGSDKKIKQILGTAFFVGIHPTVVTAKHVFVDNPLEGDEKYWMVLLNPNRPPQLWQINQIMFSDKYDIAAFNAKGVSGANTLKLARREWPNNRDVLTYEFSSTQISESQDGKREINFTPFTHKGNIMCYYDSDYPEVNVTRVFEVSFPILQGASGAPVVRDEDFAVVGMFVASRERDITPAQIITIKDKNKSTEEYKYFLPTGKAIASSIIIDFLSSKKCNPVIVD